MGKLKIVTAKGYTQAEALEKSGLKIDAKFNVTPSFKKEGKPTGKYLEAFAFEALDSRKLTDVAGVGGVIVVESGVADTRERPYKVTPVTTKGSRKWKMVYEGVVGADKDGNGGTIVFSKDTKSEAETAGKAYVTENKVGLTVRVAKVVDGSIDKETKVKSAGQPIAMTIDYTPSINTAEGEYIFFGYEAE